MPLFFKVRKNLDRPFICTLLINHTDWARKSSSSTILRRSYNDVKTLLQKGLAVDTIVFKYSFPKVETPSRKSGKIPSRNLDQDTLGVFNNLLTHVILSPLMNDLIHTDHVQPSVFRVLNCKFSGYFVLFITLYKLEKHRL